MRWGLMLLLSICAAGCASHPPQVSQEPATQPVIEPVSASALVFTPPIAAGEPQLALSREGRSAEAFVGFDQITTSYHYVRFDDRQSDDFRDGYERRSVSVKTGVSRR